MYIRVCMQAQCDRMCYQKWILLNGKRKQLHYKLCAIFLQIENRRRRAPTNARDGAKCSCGCMMHEAKRGATMAALNLLFSSSQNRKEAEPNGPKKTIKLHTHIHIRTCADKCSKCLCVCKYVFVIALPVAHSRDYRKSHRVVACTYVFTLYASTFGCVRVCARKGVQVAYGVGPGAGTRTRAMQIARTCTTQGRSRAISVRLCKKLLIIMRI